MRSFGASFTGWVTPENTKDCDDKDFSAHVIGYAFGEELIPLGVTNTELKPEIKKEIVRYNSSLMSNVAPRELSSTGGKMMIEEGTILRSDSWSHKVTAKDKNIKIRNKKNRQLCYLEVTDKTRTPNIPLEISDFAILLNEDYVWSTVNHIPAYFTNFNISTSKTKVRGESVEIKEKEQIAIETLRDMITETDFRKFLRYGFILVKAPSGKVYQIFRTASHTRVWRNGKVIEEICVRIKGKKIPLTDNLIAFKTMIEGSEEEFRKIGNIYKMEKAA